MVANSKKRNEIVKGEEFYFPLDVFLMFTNMHYFDNLINNSFKHLYIG